MSLRNLLKRSGFWLGTTFAFAGLALAAPATAPPAAPAAASREVTDLFKDIRADAARIHAHAWQWERLTSNPRSRWTTFDSQWNVIKPAEEDISLKLAELKDMRSDLSISQWGTVQHCMAIYGRVESNEHTLRVLLDEPGAKLSSPGFRIDSMILADQARLLQRAA
jgi:hypothetical protein